MRPIAYLVREGVAHDDCCLALLADADHCDRDSDQLADSLDVTAHTRGQFGERACAGWALAPSGHLFEDWLGVDEHPMRRRHVVVALSLHDIADADFNRIDPGQNVELGQCERPHPVDASGVPREDTVEPSDTTRTPGGAADLVAFFAQRIRKVAGDLAGKRACADSRRVALADAQPRLEVAGPDAGAAKDTARDATRRP